MVNMCSKQKKNKKEKQIEPQVWNKSIINKNTNVTFCDFHFLFKWNILLKDASLLLHMQNDRKTYLSFAPNFNQSINQSIKYGSMIHQTIVI